MLDILKNLLKYKKTLYVLLLVGAVFLVLKMACFFMPFFIALIIATLMEPFIKLICRKTKLVRKYSAIIALIVVFSVLIGVIVISTILITAEITKILSDFSRFGNDIFKSVENVSRVLKLEDVNVSDDVKQFVINMTNEVLGKGLGYFKDFLINILNLATQIPSFIVYLIITILATYFITTDKISLLDDIEQRVPKKWIKKASTQFQSVISVLGKFLKAEITLVFISFLLVLIGLYIFKFLGMNVKSPFLIALGIGFVDLLPILGSGTVMIPWGIILIIMGDVTLGVSVLGLLVLITVVRQFLEPKVVSNNLGIHPLYTLIAMYIGFKVSGVLGLLIGPIILIIIINFLTAYMKYFVDD
ncbi:MAG: sporulation integral membrane protein YtvI [Clostridia bacterium]|nr:sporulation integral membrane protein YtvI [Clostridia bacterium]MBP3464327.1 sporulation integral membrane protein YtvI [Clostridia bacterium]